MRHVPVPRAINGVPESSLEGLSHATVHQTNRVAIDQDSLAVDEAHGAGRPCQLSSPLYPLMPGGNSLSCAPDCLVFSHFLPFHLEAFSTNQLSWGSHVPPI